MDLMLLEDFLELAREMNFSRAAEKRNMTQPAFSRRIKALEEAVQTALVVRTTRKAELTPAGRAFLPRAEAIVRSVADAKREAIEAAENERRTLNLAATHALSYRFVPQWLTQVAQPAEVGTLNMVSDTYRQCVRLLSAGHVSFFITHLGFGSSLPDMSSKQFVCEKIGEDHLVPMCAPGADGAPLWDVTKAEESIPYIAYGAASGLHAILEGSWARGMRPNLRPVMSSVLAATNLEMAKAGHGIAYLPMALAEYDLERGHLVQVGDDSHVVPVQIVIARSRSRLSRHCEEFWERVAV